MQKQLADVSIQESGEFQLKAVPNPFNNQLSLRFQLQQASDVAVNVYSSTGALIRQVYRGTKNAGVQQLTSAAVIGAMERISVKLLLMKNACCEN
jgi:hypothetical protein